MLMMEVLLSLQHCEALAAESCALADFRLGSQSGCWDLESDDGEWRRGNNSRLADYCGPSITAEAILPSL